MASRAGPTRTSLGAWPRQPPHWAFATSWSRRSLATTCPTGAPAISVLAARPEVFNHNVETVPRLYARVRPEADLERSLLVLRLAAEAGLVTKSGLMVGLGEGRGEVLEVLRRLRGAGCRMVTIGQYLRPSPSHLPVARFVPPEEFEEYRKQAEALGFTAVAAGPFVRSSYHAGESYRALAARERNGDKSGALRTSTT